MRRLLLVLLATVLTHCGGSPQPDTARSDPYTLVLGVAQDAGRPQAGTPPGKVWADPQTIRYATSLALIDPQTGQRWLFEATPDFKQQLALLDSKAPSPASPGLDGVFLTHAHIGHYLGLAQLGHEVIGARRVPVYAMPRMAEFLSSNGPWDQLVRYQNIEVRPLQAGRAVELNSRLKVTPLTVPHRQEYSEVVAYRIDGPGRSVLFLPDIDSWEELDDLGIAIEDWIALVDVAYLDGSFFANGEIPGRDMSGFPHPFITHSLDRFAPLSSDLKARIRFIHLNHTNPALDPDSEARKKVIENGFRVAERLEIVTLN